MPLNIAISLDLGSLTFIGSAIILNIIKLLKIKILKIDDLVLEGIVGVIDLYWLYLVLSYYYIASIKDTRVFIYRGALAKILKLKYNSMFKILKVLGILRGG